MSKIRTDTAMMATKQPKLNAQVIMIKNLQNMHEKSLPRAHAGEREGGWN